MVFILLMKCFQKPFGYRNVSHSLADTEETGAMGREIESRQGVG
jgi:hypothetical protein